MQINMDGVSIEEWMQVARFLYPVTASSEVQGWQETELLPRIGAQFDMPLLLQAADRFMVQNTPQSVCSETSEVYIWKWLKLADHHGLRDSMAAIAAHTVRTDREGCIFTSSLEQLSWSAMSELIQALVRCHAIAVATTVAEGSAAGAPVGVLPALGTLLHTTAAPDTILLPHPHTVQPNLNWSSPHSTYR
jgi:hypothetical protein